MVKARPYCFRLLRNAFTLNLVLNKLFLIYVDQDVLVNHPAFNLCITFAHNTWVFSLNALVEYNH